MKYGILGLGGLMAVLALGFGLNYYGFATWAFFAPREAQVQSNVFHQSQQYQDAQSVNLGQYRISYAECGNDACRDAIRSVVQEQYANYPEDKLTPDLRDFLDKMKGV